MPQEPFMWMTLLILLAFGLGLVHNCLRTIIQLLMRIESLLKNPGARDES